MAHLLDTHPWIFPAYLIGMWLIVTSILGLTSRWYALMRSFPDQNEEEILRLKNQSGSMGGVSMRGIIDIAVCRSGLRFRMLRIFGPFCQSFFVPWTHIRVERKGGLLEKTATLRFGEPSVGSLRIASHIADSLARSSQGRWPEAGAFPEEPPSEILTSIFREWLFGTCLASLFFTIVPRVAAPNAKDYPPIAVAILFPAIVLGIAAMFRYFARTRRGK